MNDQLEALRYCSTCGQWHVPSTYCPNPHSHPSDFILCKPEEKEPAGGAPVPAVSEEVLTLLNTMPDPNDFRMKSVPGMDVNWTAFSVSYRLWSEKVDAARSSLPKEEKPVSTQMVADYDMLNKAHDFLANLYYKITGGATPLECAEQIRDMRNTIAEHQSIAYIGVAPAVSKEISEEEIDQLVHEKAAEDFFLKGDYPELLMRKKLILTGFLLARDHGLSSSVRAAGEGWVPVSERLPEPNKNVMIVAPGYAAYPITIGYVSGKGEWYDPTFQDTLVDEPLGTDVTHWRELPPPPTDKDQTL